MRRSTSFLPVAAGALAAIVAACAPAGGSSARRDSTDTALDQGTYTEDEFGYVDPRPAEFHPLTEEVSTLVRTDEVAVLVGATGVGWVRDDYEDVFDDDVALPPGANDDLTVVDCASDSGLPYTSVAGQLATSSRLLAALKHALPSLTFQP